MRITGGRARSIPLKAPDKGTRPAMDAIREKVFSSLGPQIEGAHVLDLFAGTGAYGLEALSRGASHATFVEKNARAIGCIKDNATAVAKSLQLKATEFSEIRKLDVKKLPPLPQPIDYIFADPPYALIKEVSQWLPKLLLSNPSTKGATLLFEMPGEYANIEFQGYTCTKTYGKAKGQQPCVLRLVPEDASCSAS